MNLVIQGLKLFCISQILLSSGTGFAKVTEIINEVGSALDKVAQTEVSFANLSWIPLLALQLLTTVFNVLQFYFMIRELFENNYMNKHCYKTAYTLTLLIYLLSVFPKTLINLVSNLSEETSLDDLPRKLLDLFDGLLSATQALCFQIVLFQDVVIAALQKCGICTGKEGESVDSDSEDGPDKNKELFGLCGCCIKCLVKGGDIDDPENQSKIRFKIAKGIREVGERFKKVASLKEAIKKKTAALKDKIDSTKHNLAHKILIVDSLDTDGILEDSDTEGSEKPSLIGKGIKALGGFYKKAVALSDTVKNRKEELLQRLRAALKTLADKIPRPAQVMSAISAKIKVKGSRVGPEESLELGSFREQCRRMETPRDGSIEDYDTSQFEVSGCEDTVIDIDQPSDLPDPCEDQSEVQSEFAIDANGAEMANGCPVKCPAACRVATDKCCACYTNRKVSFMVTFAMANTQLLIYIAEIVLLFCIPCSDI